MINSALINPQEMVIVGGSNNILKPGGKIVKNLLDGGYAGNLFVVNPKESKVQNLISYQSVKDIPKADLAIIVVPAKFCFDIVKELCQNKSTKAVIILSAGFGEAGELGIELEQKIVEEVSKAGACLIGPNCIGVLTEKYKGIFTSPIPNYNKEGCDLISSSGATAVFIMEAGIPLGLKFANVFSVGNAGQIGVEDVLEYMDLNYNPNEDAKVKLLYMEAIKDPKKLLKHAKSLIDKGVKIAAIKAGVTEAGSRAAASHTGALASSDRMVRALFNKAGIVYCSSREELISVASIFNYKELQGKNIAIITHAGGSAVMLTDALTEGGLIVPPISGKHADQLLTYLHPGSSVANPIDFLATGTAEQLGIIIDYCEYKFDNIDAMVVVFGSPGLFDVANVYDVLSVKLDVCKKPIFPVLPSVINAREEINTFLSKGNINFPDEVMLGRSMSQVYQTPKPIFSRADLPVIDKSSIRDIIDNAEEGFLDPQEVSQLLDAARIPRAKEVVVKTSQALEIALTEYNFPIAMKVVGPIHKSDLGGVVLNVDSIEKAMQSFEILMAVESAHGVLLQTMHSGIELFIGVNREPDFGHVLLCGLGGIFIEVLEDVSSSLLPVTRQEVKRMIRQLKGYKLFQGIRGQVGVDETVFENILLKTAALVDIAPEIEEMDMNPLFGNSDQIIAVDARIKIKKL